MTSSGFAESLAPYDPCVAALRASFGQGGEGRRSLIMSLGDLCRSAPVAGRWPQLVPCNPMERLGERPKAQQIKKKKMKTEQRGRLGVGVGHQGGGRGRAAGGAALELAEARDQRSVWRGTRGMPPVVGETLGRRSLPHHSPDHRSPARPCLCSSRRSFFGAVHTAAALADGRKLELSNLDVSEVRSRAAASQFIPSFILENGEINALIGRPRQRCRPNRRHQAHQGNQPQVQSRSTAPL